MHYRLVIVESPYGSDDDEIVARNVEYARAAMADCLSKGDAPFASHLLYTQPGVLNDRDPDERRRGIEAGLAWGRVAQVTVVYTDLGITDGMKKGINRAHEQGRSVLYRTLDAWADKAA